MGRDDHNDAPLRGIRIIDAGQVVAGPMIGTLLGDFGAEVIKIEHPRGGDPYRTFSKRKDDIPLAWKVLARNKKSVTLNLGTHEGIRVLRRLVERSDVLILSFRPSTLDRWGLDYESLSRVNPKLILVLVSGFGQEGPYRDRPGFGSLAEAMSGFAHITGQPDGPPTLPPFTLADSVAALYGALGTMIALFERDHAPNGKGQVIDVALVESLFSILGPMATLYDQLGIVQERMGNRIPSSAPRNVYKTKDDRWLMISASVQRIAERTFQAMGRPELIEDARFNSNENRVANVEELDQIIGEWVARLTRDEALEVLLAHDVAAGPVMDIGDLVDDPQFKIRQAILEVRDQELGMIKMQGVFPKLSRTPGSVTHAGPPLGLHTQEILMDVGFRPPEIEELRRGGIV